MLPEFGPEICFDLLEVQGLHSGTRTSVNPWLVANDLGPQGLRESTHWLSEVSLEEFNNGGREVERLGTFQDVLLREAVRGHPLGKVANNL